MYGEEFEGGGVSGEGGVMPRYTSPEIVRTPLDELVLQVCLLEEHTTTSITTSTATSNDTTTTISVGTSPIIFLNNAPEPPPTKSLLYACHHLVQIGALVVLTTRPTLRVRLTPLGYHLAHMPMDPKVGKILIVGSMLRCIGPALTVAATLSCSKGGVWLDFVPGEGGDGKRLAVERHEGIVRDGFGGGVVYGDLVAAVAAFDTWKTFNKGGGHGYGADKERRKFARENALDHNALLEIKGLRTQFQDSLVDAGLWEDEEEDDNTKKSQIITAADKTSNNNNNDDAHLTSCCLVAGLYPNIATIMRPSDKHRIRGGKLVIKGGDTFVPSSSSFQRDRVRNAKKDTYAVFLSKHQNVGSTSGTNTTSASKKSTAATPFSFLSEVNFVSRFSLLLFGGDIVVRDNCLIVDGWLKFKVTVRETDDSNGETKKKKKGGGGSSEAYAILIRELRKELDIVMLEYIGSNGIEKERRVVLDGRCKRVIDVVKHLLADEVPN